MAVRTLPSRLGWISGNGLRKLALAISVMDPGNGFLSEPCSVQDSV